MTSIVYSDDLDSIGMILNHVNLTYKMLLFLPEYCLNFGGGNVCDSLACEDS